MDLFSDRGGEMIQKETEAPTENPLQRFLRRQDTLMLDGGLATALESRGCDLNDPLWSAKVLIEAPDLIRQVHLDFLQAGADCITTSSYQASLPGFHRHGLDEAAGAELLALSVQLAVAAREEFWEDPANRRGRQRPLVAASIGPYAAFLADGSEYTGRYQATDQELYDFHLSRWRILAESEADVLACETIPVGREAEVLLRLLRETSRSWAWFSFCCRDHLHLSDGTRLVDAVAACENEPRVVAVGINCTAPEFIPSLIHEAKAATQKPVLVYPNSGERYEAVTKTWHSSPSSLGWEGASRDWVRAGASGVGGCCRVGPDRIADIRRWVVD
jgi:homocysteine S-methyltransferase